MYRKVIIPNLDNSERLVLPFTNDKALHEFCHALLVADIDHKIDTASITTFNRADKALEAFDTWTGTQGSNI